ncbi:MAG: signal peptidase II [Ferrovum sp. 34-44-207]|jgi:signal peptidase II|uniref:signal peptidase II n=1 Tax=Ferrovum sp. PN-J185 TaxID=1356306 RepID=UPI000798EC17|nr:signal peptidase II [Ferrovum sp. PN-J185]MDE1891100.1 lipoprotein signal peptidase [Betaproteobacteria bacterium]OZB32794.1 MAG: signal peptidase II [Ferrovum sp. 34-44-207]HQT82221.1 signal peptidase II [Ferrovaceae bacterium]KXW55802.1 lipoprotein signal peptidase [Ferrovum sp. PN-J185]MDE2057114.1 lipoprotein signal peptidase [Betaproteobacteria bacterium]
MRNFRVYLLIVMMVIAVDQWTKSWVLSHLIPYHDVITVNSLFNIVLAKNPGAAFSLLANAGGWQRYFFTAIAVTAVIWLCILIYRHQQEHFFSISLSLILGGALGNLIDRLYVGVVTDFIQWHVGEHYWPSFNIADSAITVGVICLIWDGLFKKND